MAGMYRRIMTWLDERFGAGSVEDFLRHKTIPIHRHTVWYYFGGMTLFLFIVQVLTGILLLLYYRPTASDAFESVQYVVTQVQFGWLIRSVHSWSANLMILTAFIHMFSVYFLKAYRKPRELTWVTGMLLLFIVLGFGFSGYLLPWSQLSFFATKVGTDIAGVVPLIGPFLLRFLRGGDDDRRHQPRHRRAGLRHALAHPRSRHLRAREGQDALHLEPRTHRAPPRHQPVR